MAAALPRHGVSSVGATRWVARQTIEVNRQRVIVQCRGRFNALPTPQEIEMLRRWATAEGLVIAGHVG